MATVYIEELGREIEAPSGWSYTAVRIFADKYLSPQDNNSILKALRRVAEGVARGDSVLAEKLYHGMIDQRFAFNSPVYFNVGVEAYPQCSACFIQSVDDDMESILDLVRKEGLLFRYGSGSGSNLSRLRGSMEPLTGGGVASGPVSFMRGYDAFAGVIKSGGKTRRAAKMQLLDVDHPDIEDFIECKAREERKAKDLIQKAGYDNSFDGEAYSSVFFQNANLSVRVTDAFMQAVYDNGGHALTARTTGEILRTLPARQLFRKMAECAHECGDPGIQFADTINSWHTCPEYGSIEASNPCSEYLFLNETSCNLASLNLVKYLDEDDQFDAMRFVNDIDVLVTAMDNIVSLAGYPTTKIRTNSLVFRTLGLGFTNLGELLIRKGLRYDTETAREYASAITALMHFAAYRSSADLAIDRKPYPGFVRDDHVRVYNRHVQEFHALCEATGDTDLRKILETTRNQIDATGVLLAAENSGFRNAQVTVLAPTGTISFIMDCATTGIEPLFSRSSTKKLAGGGTVALKYVDTPAVVTADEISPRDHLLMMAACQPFISGGISKTINMPSTATVDEIEEVYAEAHRLGLKAVAVYRDGCKLSQPMNHNVQKLATENRMPYAATRHPLPSTRSAITHKFSVAGHDGYATVGMYEDGRPGELFVHVAKEGSTVSGLLDSWAITLSIALQHGVPLHTILDKLTFVRFEPSGLTGNSGIPIAHSLIDYLARWLLLTFGDQALAEITQPSLDANACPSCGSTMQRTGTCFSCHTCGHNGGCG